MNLSQWEPFREVEEFMSRMTPALTRWRRETNGSAAIQWSPTADISETDKEFLICAELPGIAREDVKLSIEDGVLTLSGERQHEKEDKTERFHRIERFQGCFARSFSLPEAADTSRIHAESHDGTLTVHIPKTAKAATKRVDIKVS
ncbi:MAG: Hsp20/alpha crystallin family protein [Steroidobacteraceae bacterium]|jgi:HSP20 family protein|nr:Hsp20/alpha crystallin family protein [Gammaproteobacteria bacterium]